MRGFTWFCGLYEGDGSCNGSLHNRPYIQLQIQMTDKDVLDEVVRIVGGAVSGPYERGDHPQLTRKDGTPCPQKDMWAWKATGSSEEKYWLVRRMIPYMCSRRRGQLEAMLEKWLEHKGWCKLEDWKRDAEPPSKKALIMHYRALGWGYKRIARELGITRDLVRYHVKTS